MCKPKNNNREYIYEHTKTMRIYGMGVFELYTKITIKIEIYGKKLFILSVLFYFILYFFSGLKRVVSTSLLIHIHLHSTQQTAHSRPNSHRLANIKERKFNL